jgi:ceramide glucosyltransferase
MLIVLQEALLLLISSSVAFYIWCTICTVRFFTSKRETGTESQAVSLLVPVCGVDEGADENWASLCRQDHESYEVLFGVMDPQDPAVPILKELVAKFPDRARLLCGLEVLGVNHQISNLMHLLEAAHHEVVIFADSDIRVNPEYIRTVTAPLVDPEIGVVTCTYVDHDPKLLGAALASLGRCIDFIPSVLVARSLDGALRFALGPTIATRKSVLTKIGGLQDIVNRIGSDYHIGSRVAAAGYRVELSDYILENDCGRETLWQVFQRELRWARTIRWNRGLQYYGLGLSYGTVYCIPLLLLSGFQSWAVIVCFVTLVYRTVQALVAIYSLGCLNLSRWFWALPIRDLMSFAIWVAGTFGQSIYWRGRQLSVGADGTLTERVDVTSHGADTA